jgi:hypothetical protein
MAHTCRGTINLVGAVVETLDPCSFVITNGGTHTFYLRAASEVERQRWVTALELAKAEAMQMSESGKCINFPGLRRGNKVWLSETSGKTDRKTTHTRARRQEGSQTGRQRQTDRQMDTPITCRERTNFRFVLN